MPDEVHYVLILTVQKITKTVKITQPGNRTWGTQNKTEETGRDITEVAKVVIKDKGLPELKERGTQHLALIEDDI